MTYEGGIKTHQPKKRTRDKNEKIKLIYKSFFDLVGKMGYSNVSTNHIAATAGISVGTIYRYFPQGKLSIIKDYFDSTQEEVFDIDSIASQDIADLHTFFKTYIVEYVRVHRQAKVIHQAYEQAMLENPEVLQCYTQKVIQFIKKITGKLHQIHPVLKQVPIDHIESVFLLVFNVFEALTRQHLFITPLFPTDEKFIDFLMDLLDFLTRPPGAGKK